MTNKINQSLQPEKIPEPHSPPKPLNTWKHLVAHLCIWFLVVVLVMVYFTSTGSPQAGLLEVGISAMIFVVLFHLVMKFFPVVSKIITSVIVIGFGIALIFVNYHYLKVVKKDASLEQLLVGDLFVHKILKTVKKEPAVFVAREEMPKTVTKPKYEILQPEIFLDQLETTIAKPVLADDDLTSLPLKTLAPMIKTVIARGGEKRVTEAAAYVQAEEISGLLFTTKNCKPIIQPVMTIQDIPFVSRQNFIQETTLVQLQSHKIQSPLSEMVECQNTMIDLNGPLTEGHIPVN